MFIVSINTSQLTRGHTILPYGKLRSAIISFTQVCS